MTPDTDAMHAYVLANLDSMALECMVPVGHAQKWEQRALAAEAALARAQEDMANMDEALRENREKWGWKCIMSIGQRILDEVYPADIFTGESGDLGPRYIVALREAIKAINETR